VTDDGRSSPRLAALIAQVAPGTVLRRGLERMIRANTGGMIVLGDSPNLRALLSGGFRIDVLVTAQRLSELSKMDGAIVLDAEAATILWANVQLMPERAIPTAESGTRHRTTERVARQTGLTVIAVSKSMRVVTLYAGTERYVVPELTAVHARAEQALQAIERYRARFDQAVGTLNRLELTDKVTLRNVVQVLTSGELLTRLAAELGEHVAELGTEGRLLALQADQLLAGLEAKRACCWCGTTWSVTRPGTEPGPTRPPWWTHWPGCRPRSCSSRAWWPPSWTGARGPMTSTARWLRAGTGCCPGCPG